MRLNLPLRPFLTRPALVSLRRLAYRPSTYPTAAAFRRYSSAFSQYLQLFPFQMSQNDFRFVWIDCEVPSRRALVLGVACFVEISVGGR